MSSSLATLDRGACASPSNASVPFAFSSRALTVLDSLGERFTIVRLVSPDMSDDDGPFGLSPRLQRELGWSQQLMITLTHSEPADFIAASYTPLIVVGARNHAHPFARAAIDAAKRSNERALAVDLATDAVTNRYADIVTNGCSARRSEALVRVLTGRLSAAC